MKFPIFDFHILEIMKKTLGQNEIPKFESQNMILANTVLKKRCRKINKIEHAILLTTDNDTDMQY